MIFHIRDFITDEKNCTSAFVEAIGRLNSGDVLCLDGGRYDFRPEGALVKHYYISNNDGGEKPIALPIIGKEKVTIDGGGAELVFHGEMLPVVVDCSKNITLKGFSIDYEVPMYGQAEIVEATEDKTVLKFDGNQFWCRVDENGDWCFYSESPDWKWERHRRSHVLSMEFDREGKPTPGTSAYFPHTGGYEDHGFLNCMYREVELEQLGENLIAMHGKTGIRHTVGNTFIMTYNTREYPGVFTNNSDDLVYEDITLYHTMSMGFITQNSENIVLRRINAQPRRDLGRLLSVSCDATHFVNCRGRIELDSCTLEYMMDDACNIHGNYHIYESQDAQNTLILRFGHYQQSGANTYRKGDLIYIIDVLTTDVISEARVEESEVLSATHMKLKLDRAVPAPGGRWVIENITTSPEVYIHDCISGYNRPRGFLLSSRGKALVENCSFHNIEQGIQLSGELADWYESGPALDVTVRNCDFTNSAYCGGCAIVTDPHIEAKKCNPDIIYSGRVLIEGNHFEQGGKRIMIARHAAEVIFRNNTFRQNDSYYNKHSINESGIIVEKCGKADIELPRVIS